MGIDRPFAITKRDSVVQITIIWGTFFGGPDQRDCFVKCMPRSFLYSVMMAGQYSRVAGEGNWHDLHHQAKQLYFVLNS